MNYLTFFAGSILFAIKQASLQFSNTEIVGVADENQHLYNKDLKCPSTGLKLTTAQINDGVCDCPDDGFDEPGTAACENGKFFCKNVGYQGEHVSSFKVNDGVCDCCDGSDEFSNRFLTNCPNTCVNLKNFKVREAYLHQAKKKKAQKYFQSSKIKAFEAQNEFKVKLDEINAKIDELNLKTTSDSSKNVVEGSPETVESFLADYRLKLDQLEFLIANLTSSSASSSLPLAKETNTPGNNESSWKSVVELKLKKTRDLFAKIRSIGATPTTVTKYLPTIVTKTVVQFEPTQSYGETYNDYEYERDSLVTQAQEIEQVIKETRMYGPDLVFLPLKDKCFQHKSGSFTYELCWFKDVHQRSKSGSATLIGTWKNWEEEEVVLDQSSEINEIVEKPTTFKKMIFNDGDHCGSTPRQAVVHLECGWTDGIISVEEPSMCFYEFKFSSPLACIL